jgi:hypothetical protein
METSWALGGVKVKVYILMLEHLFVISIKMNKYFEITIMVYSSNYVLI